MISHPEYTYDGSNLLAGTIGLPPYKINEGRYIAMLKNPQENIEKYQILPRLTGLDRTFHGVVLTNQDIPLSELIIIDSRTMKPCDMSMMQSIFQTRNSALSLLS